MAYNVLIIVSKAFITWRQTLCFNTIFQCVRIDVLTHLSAITDMSHGIGRIYTVVTVMHGSMWNATLGCQNSVNPEPIDLKFSVTIMLATATRMPNLIKFGGAETIWWIFSCMSVFFVFVFKFARLYSKIN